MDIRKEFLDYFEGKGHKILPSSPLVPNDASLLFTNAGMVQFKPIFTGETPPFAPPRAATSQTCVRAGGKHNDLENVGYTARHHTFFEMLGNFSFGDYFKEEAIAFAWEFLTAKLDLPREKLYVSVHESDDEAEKLWLKFVPKERIKRFGDKDNFWQMGETGPCGPCSEIYYDQGGERFSTSEDYFGGDGDRFLEIWNLVFMQYNRAEGGKLTPLPKPSIDTGMGLERVTAIKEGVFSNYDSSIFRPLLAAIAEITGVRYDPNAAGASSQRVIADHLRSASFLLAQGVGFDRDGRGYVLRRILRRAVRHGYLLGCKEPFLHLLTPVLAEQMGAVYPYLLDRGAVIQEQIREEEARFFTTIENGMKLFDAEIAKKPAVFSGESAFKLYDTYGFPLDLTQDMLRNLDISLDTAGFDAAMDRQKKSAKAAWKGSGDLAIDGDFRAILEKFGANEFVGYENTRFEAKILAILDENFRLTDRLSVGETGWVFLDKTPLYASGGGQIGDSGAIAIAGETAAEVLTTEKFHGLNFSQVKTRAPLQTNAAVTAIVSAKRAQIAKHHSATHLLHAALGEILGEGAAQAGSAVDENRLRFDFSFGKAVNGEQLRAIERRVNEMIAANLAGETRVLPIDEARKMGAKALFSEKYGDQVRVVKFGDESIEFCGGAHVLNTGQIGVFAIVKESGVSAGARRIEAVAGEAAILYLMKFRETCEALSETLKTQDLLAAAAKLQETIREQKKMIEKLQSGGESKLEIVEIGGVKTVIALVEAGDPKAMVDDFKNRFERAAAMIFSPSGNGFSVVCGVKNAPVKAGEWIKGIGAKGGGRDDFASGGGVSDLTTAQNLALEFLKSKMA
ncbi:MAG: alanine--tRNA ligase [Helicobacteraceae bacterium]|jgi:alanyl-tRNA synthetase|nr:alanine--tRNA ligase [Helicobacteraceae bacterium]